MNGLVLWLPFSRGKATDKSKQHNNGTLAGTAGTPTAIAGKFGNALDFDSTDAQYVNVADSASLSITGNITISMWIKSNTKASASKFRVGVKKRRTGSDCYEIYFDENGYTKFIVDTGTAKTITGGTDIFDNAWHHVVGYYDGAKIYLYIDNSSDATGVAQTGSMTDTSDSLVIGFGASLHTIFEAFNGSIDDVRIFNRALSLREIADLYNGWKPETRILANNRKLKELIRLVR